MEMKGLIIGVGAAGNKSVINLVENEVVSKDDIILVNSTTMDVPDAYKSMTHILSGTDGGFGKERARSKEAMLTDLQAGRLKLKDKVADGNYKFIAVITSTEGGTGSGAATMLAQYITRVIMLPVHLIGFTGFGTDGRGLQNTMEFMQDITKNMIVHLIRNDRFMQENDGSIIKSELAANEELANTIRTITGQLIKESTHNIDPTDIKKVVNMPGYEIVEYYELEEKIRNKKDFDRILAQMCDDSHAMQSHGMGRLGIILNLNENSQLYANDDTVLRNRYGVPYEPFIHRQHEGKEFIAFICSGMKMPMEEVKEIYEQYQIASEQVDKSEDDFFAEVAGMKGNSKDSMFDTHAVAVNSGDEDAFFSSMMKGSDSDSKKPATTPASEY